MSSMAIKQHADCVVMQQRLISTELYIKQKIAITEHTAFRLLDYQGDCLHLLCPMAGNENNHGTLFGGSLAMVSIIAGYALSFLVIEDYLGKNWQQHYQLVIKYFHCSYKKPVESDALFSAALYGAADGLLESLEKTGKATLPVLIRIAAEGAEKLASQANYVIFRKAH